VVCADCVEAEDAEDENIDAFIAAENAGGPEMSAFGLPKNHDGALPTQTVMYVQRTVDITPEGWAHLALIRYPNWAIIPLEVMRHGNHVPENRPN
jgi:hypothetical protein